MLPFCLLFSLRDNEGIAGTIPSFPFGSKHFWKITGDHFVVVYGVHMMLSWLHMSSLRLYFNGETEKNFLHQFSDEWDDHNFHHATLRSTLLMVDRTSHRSLLIVVHSVFSGETVMTFLHQFSGVITKRYLHQFSGKTVMTFLHHNSSGEQKWLSWYT